MTDDMFSDCHIVDVSSASNVGRPRALVTVSSTWLYEGVEASLASRHSLNIPTAHDEDRWQMNSALLLSAPYNEPHYPFNAALLSKPIIPRAPVYVYSWY